MRGRCTVDNILVFQEVVHSYRSLKGKRGFMALKLDLEKAYDRLSWSFILESLRFFGFGDSFIELIRWCVSSSSMTLAWRGSYTESFKPLRGVRQGDPISIPICVVC